MEQVMEAASLPMSVQYRDDGKQLEMDGGESISYARDLEDQLLHSGDNDEQLNVNDANLEQVEDYAELDFYGKELENCFLNYGGICV